MILPDTIPMEIRHFHLFGGLGGGALGFQNGHARAGRLYTEVEEIDAVVLGRMRAEQRAAAKAAKERAA